MTAKEPLPRPFNWRHDIIRIHLRWDTFAIHIGRGPVYFNFAICKYYAWADKKLGTNYVGMHVCFGRPRWDLYWEWRLWKCKDFMTFEEYNSNPKKHG